MGDLKIEVKKKRTGRKIFSLMAALLVILGLLGLQLLNRQYLPVDPSDNNYIEIIIPGASNAQSIGALLEQNGLIRSKGVFLAYCRQKGLDQQLQAGHFRFSRSQSLPEIVQDIVKGKVVNITFTVPEGYTVDQIGELMVKKGVCTSEAWQQAINREYDYDFLRESQPAAGKSYLEGFLFPDTYYVTENTDIVRIIELMLSRFEKVWQENLAEDAARKGMNVYETVVLASMIEREAMVPEERTIISGVIKNRLESGTLLQIDATVLYSLNESKDTVTYADLKVDSPYNTYKYPGLPPGPISCPGKASLEAALNPDTHNYYYYVSRGDGTHEFNRTYSEHLAAKRKYGL